MVRGHHSCPLSEALVTIRLLRSSLVKRMLIWMLVLMLVRWVWVQSERRLVHQLEGHGYWLVVGGLMTHGHGLGLVHGVLGEGALVRVRVVR